MVVGEKDIRVTRNKHVFLKPSIDDNNWQKKGKWRSFKLDYEKMPVCFCYCIKRFFILLFPVLLISYINAIMACLFIFCFLQFFFANIDWKAVKNKYNFNMVDWMCPSFLILKHNCPFKYYICILIVNSVSSNIYYKFLS